MKLSSQLLKLGNSLKEAAFRPVFQSINSPGAPYFKSLPNLGFTHIDFVLAGSPRWRKIAPQFEQFFKRIKDFERIPPKGIEFKKLSKTRLEDNKIADIYEVTKAGKTFKFALVSGKDVYAIYTTDPRMINALI